MNVKSNIIIYLVSRTMPLILGILFLSCSEDISPVDEQPKQEDPVELNVIPFDKVPSLEEMVMYEVNFMAFNPGFDFNAVEEKLDHIKGHGVNVIWLMPIHPEGIQSAVGSPYSVQDYLDVNPEFGSMNDFKSLVAKAHEKEIAVIIDWVANHTAWDHDWISNDGWYSTDANGNIIIPPGTNWQDVAELNFNNKDMRLEMIEAMKFWIEECNIDGFRCDAVDFVPFSFWKQALDSLAIYTERDLILLAESGNKQSLNVGFQMIYGWDYQHKLKTIFSENVSASELISTHEAEKLGFENDKYRLRYITNHDICAWEESPTKSFVNKAGTVTAFVITTMIGEVPLIYTGQEIAHPNQISFFNENPLNWNINKEVYEAYQQILAIKLEYSKLVSSSNSFFKHPDVVAFTKSDANNRLLVIANVRNQSIDYSVPEELIGTWTNLINQNSEEITANIHLEPFSYYILKK